MGRTRTIGLAITTPDQMSMEKTFDSDTILIGSGPSAVLKIEHPEVSTLHAVIKTDSDGNATIVDLGSEAGTTVNGTAVGEAVRLAGGDEIGLGQVTLRITFSGDEETAKPAARASEPAENLDEIPSKPPSGALTDQMSDAQKPLESTSVVTADSDLDEGLLQGELHKHNQPTADEHALQISVRWGRAIIDACQVREPRAITVGGLSGKPKDDLAVESRLDSGVIATNRGQEAEIAIPSSAKVGVRTSDGRIKRDVPAGSYNLGFGERLAFKVGTITFVAEYVRGDAELGKSGAMDWYFPRVFAISGLLHIFFVVAAFLTPKVSMQLTDELFKNENRFAQMILKAPEKEKKRKKLDLSGAKGAKHKGDEGKFGKKDIPKKDALASKAGAPRVDPNKREKDRKIAMNAGLLGILKGKSGAGAVSNVFGPGGLGSGINNAMGGLRGSAMGDAGGAGGLGTRGTGAGGGGSALGIGGLGGGHGRGSGGRGNIDLGGRGKGTARIRAGRTIIKGSLSKQEIGRVIRRNLARFKYCYEKQLNANPNLSGKISVYFTIAPTGAVAKASIRDTSMKDRNVENCALRVMRSLRFPKPRGGGLVVVTYPFVFASSQ